MLLGPGRWREFPESSGRSPGAGVAEFLGDLTRPHGVALPPSLGTGYDYGEMLAGLIAGLVPPDQPAGTLILGFELPDLSPGRATATYLSHVCPGEPMAFAVCDQGQIIGFTALRLARDLLTDGGRVLITLAEQPWLGYQPPEPVRVPDRPAAFALLCQAGRDGPGSASGDGSGSASGDGPGHGGWRLGTVLVRPGVPAGEAGALLGHELARATAPGPPGRPGERLLVLGAGLDVTGGFPGWRVSMAGPGQPVTGPWRELARQLDGPETGQPGDPAPGQLAIAGYDARLGYLGLATFTADHSQPASSTQSLPRAQRSASVVTFSPDHSRGLLAAADCPQAGIGS